MICWPKFGITSPVIPMSPLRKLELLTRPTPIRVSFNHFPHTTKLLLLSFQRQSGPSQTFPRLHHMLGSSRATPSHLGGFTSKSNKCFTSAWRSSKCSRLRISAQNTNLSTQLKNLAPKAWISQREVGEWGWSAFYREFEKLAVGAIRVDRSDQSTIPVRLVWWPQLGSGHSLKETLWIGKFRIGPGQVRLWPDLSSGAQIPTVILFVKLV
jgi:hypothetical protein